MEEFKKGTEYSIGTELTYEGMNIHVIEDTNFNCNECVFYGKKKCNSICISQDRNDKKSIKYIKTEPKTILFNEQINDIYLKAQQYLIDLINNNGGEYTLSFSKLPRYSNGELSFENISIEYFNDMIPINSIILLNNKINAKTDKLTLFLNLTECVKIADAIIEFKL